MKLLIFDIDGTLTATNEVDSICFIKALSSFFGFSDFDTDWNQYQFVTDSGIVDEIARTRWNRSLNGEEKSRVEQIFLSLLAEHPASAFSPIWGAGHFIQKLRESNDYEVALATGCWKASAIHKLSMANIACSNIPMATSSDAHSREDVMKIAHARAFDHYKCSEFDEIVYFGDALWDVKACAELNWRMIGIGEQVDQLTEVGQKNVFRDFSSPSKIIEAIEGPP